MQQNTEFPRTCTLRHSWRFVCFVQDAVLWFVKRQMSLKHTKRNRQLVCVG